MLLYYPTFNKKWQVCCIDTNCLHFRKTNIYGFMIQKSNIYDKKIFINGCMYNFGTFIYSDRVFVDIKGALAYINRDYEKASEYLYFKIKRENI